MPPRSRVRESDSEIERQLLSQIADAAEVRAESRAVAEEVKVTAVSLSPVDTGEYAGAWHVEKQLRQTDQGLPAYRVTNDDYKAHWIEYGTGEDTEKGSRFGPNTPTPEFAVARRTAAMMQGAEAGKHRGRRRRPR